ncbi:MAG: SsrA-binding protein SmpB [Helicobacteraceae bacterium]
MKEIARNKKAFFDYEILDRQEAGIVLAGSEVKSLRAGKVSLKESFIRVIRTQMVLFGMHISRLSTTQNAYAPDEKRARNLLLHKKDIAKWGERVKLEGLAIVPLAIYFNKRNICKLDIALARGKKNYDKRQSIKEKEAKIAAKRDYKLALRDLQ